jgi:ectoine hydroxylase-related dioxygenase (phytanoyl-CoA dioxygenase family)
MHFSDHVLPGVPLVESPLFPALMGSMDLTDAERDLAIQLHERGYAVLDFPDDQLAERIDRIRAVLEPRFDVDWRNPAARKNVGDMRVQDAWIDNDDVRAIATNDHILSLLSRLYGRKAFPFQTLNFPIGTQQPMHSDSIHFSSVPEKFMCGVWLAMENVSEQAGPLLYYPGTHKWPIITNEMLQVARDREVKGAPQQPYQAAWHALVEQAGLEAELFTARKGQALIWAANLLHGGSWQINPALTRWSQVTHYFFEDCIYFTPAYSQMAVGKLDVREIRNVASGDIVPNRYMGEPVVTGGHRPLSLRRRFKRGLKSLLHGWR